MTIDKQFRAARRAGVPIIAVQTPDAAETIRTLTAALNGKAETVPVIQWDMVRGPAGINEPGGDWVMQAADGGEPALIMGNPAEFLPRLPTVPEEALVFCLNSPAWVSDEFNSQAVWNLRDSYKQTGATIVLLGGLGWQVPAMLQDDTVVMAEALPDPDALRGIVTSLSEDAGLEALPAETMSKAVDAIAGLAAYPAENAVAMSIGKEGLDLDGLRERKRQAVDGIPGLSVWRGGEKIEDVGGFANIKTFLTQLAGSKRPIQGIVFMDEIEKAFAGAAGDTSGVSKDLEGAFLTWTANKKAKGIILIGHSGTGKSLTAKAGGSLLDCLVLSLDMNACKSSLVGESGRNFRKCLASIDAICQGNVLMIATCNSINALSPEIKRRFTLGTFFFDLPSKADRDAIWGIYTEKYNRPKNEARPNDEGWTGAEISVCVDTADMLGISLKDAAAYVVPVSVSDAEKVENLRRACSNRFTSASYKGVYKYTPGQKPTKGSTGRRISPQEN